MRDCTIVCVISRETKMMEHLRYSGFSVASISSREKNSSELHRREESLCTVKNEIIENGH